MKNIEKVIIMSLALAAVSPSGCATVKDTAGVGALAGAAIAAGAGYQSGNPIEGAKMCNALGEIGEKLLKDEANDSYSAKLNTPYKPESNYTKK